MTQAVSRWSVTAKARTFSLFSPCGTCICGWSGTGRCFSGAYQFLPLTFTPLITYSHLHLNVIHILKEKRAKARDLQTNQCCLGYRRHIGQKSNFTSFF